MSKKLFFSFLIAVVLIGLSAHASQACSRNSLQAVTINDNGQSTTIQPSIQQRQDLSSWQGKYSFVESLHGSQTAMYRNYDFRLALSRCGWRAFLRVNGHITALDLQTQVVQIDSDTIGLFYQRDQIPTFRAAPFQPGALLLRIRRQQSSNVPSNQGKTAYRIYFEALKPLVPDNAAAGLAIPEPKPLKPLQLDGSTQSQ